MKIITSKALVFLIALLVNQLLFSQSTDVKISGRVVEGGGSQPVMFATVAVWDKNTKKAITGVTTKEDGSFIILSNTDQFYIEVSFIGFATKTITDFNIEKGKVDLGTISLSESSTNLNQFEVQAERSKVEFKLDKRVFNVGKDLSSTGASATEVLNNVPSVNVNIEGEVSLRGSSGVQILINGKPSIMSDEGGSLGTITADMIEKVEVITNPSAKYDAEGTSGIINIVLKKEEKKGMNGSVSLNTGIPHNHSIGVSLNRRTEKFNLFSQLGVGYRSLPKDNKNVTRNLLDSTTINSYGTEYRNEFFYNMTLGADYHINKYNVLTLSGNFAYEVEDQPSQTNFISFDKDELVEKWQRDEITEATNPKWQYEMQYQKNFKDNKDHVFLVSALGKFFGKELSSEFNNTSILGSQNDATQKTETAFGEASFTFKADYTKPFSKQITMETGGQYVFTDVSNDYAVSNLVANNWVQDANFTNLFEYKQRVLGVYVTGAYEKGKWGIKSGMRIENTELNTLLTNTNESNGQNYANFFPSVHTSFKVTETFSLQAGYSKRIRRPRLWDLNPFFNIRNNFSIRAGNPNLQPEFTDSYELNSIYVLEKVSLNLGVFHRFTTDVIERISTFENNVNITMPSNIGTNQASGVEFNAQYSLSKKVSFQGDFNYNIFIREGEYQSTSFDFNGDRWSSKLTTKLKLPFQFDFEVTGQFQSKYRTVQSTVSENLFMNLGLRKKIMKGKAVLNISVRDVFASRIRENIINQEDFYAYSYGKRGRFVTLGFSYGFGKGEAMEYSGGRRHH